MLCAVVIGIWYHHSEFSHILLLGTPQYFRS